MRVKLANQPKAISFNQRESLKIVSSLLIHEFHLLVTLINYPNEQQFHQDIRIVQKCINKIPPEYHDHIGRLRVVTNQSVELLRNTNG